MGKKLGSSITGVNDALRLCVGDPGDVALVSTSPNPARAGGRKALRKKKSGVRVNRARPP